MSLFKNNQDLLDEAAGQMADGPIDPRQIEEAAARVGARLSQEAAGGAPIHALQTPAAQPIVLTAPPAAGSLHGCDDFQALIPAYLRGELSPARALLVEDHTRNCIPCRRALRDAREAHPVQAAKPVRAAAQPRGRQNRAVWMSLAAVLAVAIGFGLVTLIQEMM